MPRILTILTLVLSALGGVVLVWYLAYGIDEKPPREVAVEGLGAPARIGWQAEGVAAIEAADETDAYAALGFAQGVHRPWSVLFLRQAALGRLGEWFDVPALSADSLARRLGLASVARTTYETLPADERALLDAFARGMNAALASDAVRHADRLLLLDLTPEPWEPWHALATERLLAWLATKPPDSLARTDPGVRALLRGDRVLRTRLRLYGFEHSVAWTGRDDAGPYLMQRHVYGATARPLFMDVALRITGEAPVAGGVLLGTPFFPAGRSGDRAWAILLRSETRLRVNPPDTLTPPLRYERLHDRDGTESLLPIRRDTSALLLSPPGGATSALLWNGLAPRSDFAAWRALLRGERPAFHLFSGTGLALDARGEVHVLGRPRMLHHIGDGVLIGHTRWTAFLAERLADDLSRDAGGRNDAYSAWAAKLAPAMIATLLEAPPLPDKLDEGLTYLRNWNFVYDRTSIAASIFDTWMRLYREATGHLPRPDDPPPDLTEKRLRLDLFTRAMGELAARYGSDPSRWRWETIQPDERYFTPWSGKPPDFPEAPPTFAPIRMPGSGHPSTLAWSPSPILPALAGSAAWEARASLASDSTLRVRRLDLAPGRFLKRYLVDDGRPPALPIRAGAPEHVTVLLPPDR
ncbi:penicillin acylase family protein [Rhodocaloribacter sp.]